MAMIAQGVKLTIVARPYFSFSPPRNKEKLGLASQTRFCAVINNFSTFFTNTYYVLRVFKHVMIRDG